MIGAGNKPTLSLQPASSTWVSQLVASAISSVQASL